MDYQITIRYGKRRQPSHAFSVEAPDVASALRPAADAIPPGVLPEVDLVELRAAVHPDRRTYVGE
jgi:hypothetical protein